jgi:hypothetical protein
VVSVGEGGKRDKTQAVIEDYPKEKSLPDGLETEIFTG